MPLTERGECEELLKPEFLSRRVYSWKNLHPSEFCAGGEPEIDACEGEGGAPLVCLDTTTDSYHALGLVNYGFGCKGTIPAVYTNLANPSIHQFITGHLSK